MIELDSILKMTVDVGLGFFEPFLEYFDPNSSSWYPFWTATPYAYDMNYAWAILVYRVYDTYTLKTNSQHVRCVHDAVN